MMLHGGDLDTIVKNTNIPRKEIKDFSGNINPLGPPVNVIDTLANNLDSIATYPDFNYAQLRKSIAEYVTSQPNYIIVGNGSTELISLFIKTIAHKRKIKVLIIAPAYSEYKRIVTLCGGTAVLYPLLESENFLANVNDIINTLNDSFSIFIVCNPNNPTGTAIDNSQMEKIAAHCKKNNIYVLIDETYAEFTDEALYSSIPLVKKHDNIFITRGCAKFFAVPGIRLGYAICSNKNIINGLNKYKDPWSVNILAAIAGEVIFKNQNYILETKQLISHQREFIYNELSTWSNIKVYETKSNFILLKILNTISSSQIFDALIKKKLLLRNAANFSYLDESFLRFCFLMPEDNLNLLKELRQLIDEVQR